MTTSRDRHPFEQAAQSEQRERERAPEPAQQEPPALEHGTAASDPAGDPPAGAATADDLPLSSQRHPDAPRPVSLLQQRGIEAEVLIPLIRRLEAELGRERAYAIAAETIAEIAREQGSHVREALGRDDLEGFTHVKDTWSGAGGDLTIETLRQDGERLEFNVVGCRFAEMYRQLGASDLGFVLSCGRDFALSEGYSDDLVLERTQTIMQGAAYCDFRYRLAQPAAHDAPEDDATTGANDEGPRDGET